MIIRCSAFLLLAAAVVPAVQAANLRAGNLVGGDTTTMTSEQHRRRMQEVSAYWTPEKIANAIPRDMHLDKPDQGVRRGLEAYTENDELVPRHLENENQFLLQMDDGTFMECTITHQPFDDEEYNQEDRR